MHVSAIFVRCRHIRVESTTVSFGAWHCLNVHDESSVGSGMFEHAPQRGDPHGAFVRDSHYCDSRGLLFARDYWSICSSEEVFDSVTSHQKAPNKTVQATPMNAAVLPLRFLRQKSMACWMAAVTQSSGAQILS